MRLIFRSSGKIILLILLMHPDSFAQKYVPHTFIAGIEAPSIFQSILSRKKNIGELQLNLNIASHMAVLEYGFQNTERSGSSFQYSTKGPYFRAGVDFTLNPKNPDGHMIFFGFRYAQANYRNSLSFDYPSEAFNNQVINTSNRVQSDWLEGTFGMKVVLRKNLVMGYTMRYKFSPDFSSKGTLSSFDLPGYGRANKKNNFGFNYYLYYKLQFRKPKAKKEVSS